MEDSDVEDVPVDETPKFNEIKEIDITLVIPNEWNPNTMNDVTFNRLVEEVKEVGFLDPIQVVEMDDGTYRILGGEHRYHAAKVLGWQRIQAVVLSGEKWKDVDLQKFVTVRLNVLRGKVNPDRMVKLYDEMAEKYGSDALQGMMAFTDQDAWDKMIKGIGRALRDSLPGVLGDKFDEAKQEIKTVEDLSNVLNNLFTNYGNTLDKNFMVFTYGGKEHIYVVMDGEMKKSMKKIRDSAMDTNSDMTVLLGPAIQQVAKGLPELTARAPEAGDETEETGDPGAVED